MISEQTPIAFTDDLPAETDVVVIGGGIVGTATAYFLARAGVKVVLCEKGRIAGEQSSRNWGWIRQQGRDAAELPIMMESNRIWQGLARETGEADLGFVQEGCYYVTNTQAGLARHEDWHLMAKEHQLECHLLSPGELSKRLPALAGTFRGGMVTPNDGRGEPFVAVPALARAAHRAGAVIRENCAVRTVDVAAGRVAGVVSEAGRVRAARVLVAGGAWSRAFLGNAGIDLAQLNVRSTAMRTTPGPEVVSANVSLPGLAIRRRADGGYTVTSADLVDHFLSPASFRYALKFLPVLKQAARDMRLLPAAPKGFPAAWGTATRWTADDESPFERMRVVNPPPAQKVIDRTVERLPKYWPGLKDLKIAQAWAGMIDVTPDAVPTLDEEPLLPGLFIATGMSGHGFGIGPACGRIMADLLRGRAPGHDMTRFRAERFRDGSPVVPGPY